MSKEAKYSATEKGNEKLLEINKTVDHIKEAQPHFQEFIKAQTKFCDVTKSWMDGGDATRTAITKIAGVRKHDETAKALRNVDTCFMELFKRRKETMESYRDHVVQKWGDDFARDRSLPEFEKCFKVKRATSLKAIKKAESNYAKASKSRAMKKAPEKAEETKRELEDAIKAHEEMLSQELHTIFLMERKRYTFFLRQISEALGNEAKALKLCEDAIEQCQQDIGGGLCADMEANFPEEVKKLIGPQELLRSGSLHVVEGSSSNGDALRSPKDDDDDDDNSSDDGDGEENGEDSGAKKENGEHANGEEKKDKGKEKKNKGKEQPKKKGKKKQRSSSNNSSDDEEASTSEQEESNQMKATPPPPSGIVAIQPAATKGAFNGSDVMRVSSPRKDENQSSHSSQSTERATSEEDEAEDLGSYLQRLDAPPPPPPRDSDMDAELDKILSSFSS